MSFSPEWLALREPVDHRSRNAEVADVLRRHFAGQSAIRVLDLGCGTGSNLRASIGLLPALQHWTLIDYDPALLAEARRMVMAAPNAVADGDAVKLDHEGKAVTVDTRQFDLSHGIRPLLQAIQPDLVTASAFFDLVSPVWIEKMARDLAETRTAFFTVLTYDGDMRFSPAHALDTPITAAFNADQRSDKGFGPAAGPAATDVMATAFRTSGMTVTVGSSPWDMGVDAASLCDPLVAGIAAAASATGQLTARDCEDWLAYRRGTLSQPQSRVVIGHGDLFAR